MAAAPIRVMHVIGQIGVGGCEMQLLNLCRRMDKDRFTTAVAYYAPNSDNMVTEFTDAGAKLYYVDKTAVSLWKFFRTLRGFIKDFTPDVIHCWQLSPNAWGRLAGLSCGQRHFVASDRTIRPCYDPWRWPLMEKFIGGGTIRLTNSNAVADYVAKSLHVPRERIQVIYNAVELPLRDRLKDRAEVRAELGLAADQKLVLTVGRQTHAKNYPMLYRAAKRVLERRGDVRFICAGHGEQEANLRQLHQELGLGDGVRMLGLRQDIPRLLFAADVFCLPSRWEGFPNALAEAMAAGLPVIAADFPGARELLVKDTTGLLVDIDDDAALAAGLLGLLEDEAMAQKLGQAAAEHVERNFSWPTLVAKMERLYSGIVRP